MSAPVPHDGVVVRNARLAVKNELEKKRLLNQPIARFDPKSGKQITLDKKRIYNIKSCSLKAGMYRMELERVR